MNTSRLADAFLAIRDHNWTLGRIGDKTILLPPTDDERHTWTAMYDEHGIPHWLPEYSKGKTD